MTDTLFILTSWQTQVHFFPSLSSAQHSLYWYDFHSPVVLVSSLPWRGVVPVFGLFAPREPLLTGSLGESAPRAEPVSGELEGDACLDLAAGLFLLSSPKLEMYLRKKQQKNQVKWRNATMKPENMDTWSSFVFSVWGYFSKRFHNNHSWSHLTENTWLFLRGKASWPDDVEKGGPLVLQTLETDWCSITPLRGPMRPWKASLCCSEMIRGPRDQDTIFFPTLRIENRRTFFFNPRITIRPARTYWDLSSLHCLLYQLTT